MKATTRLEHAHPPTLPEERGPPIFDAAGVAAGYCRDYRIDDRASVQRHELAAKLVARQLASDGRPGDWAGVDVDAFFARLSGCTAFERDGMALAFVGIFTWLALSGPLSIADAKRVLHAARRHVRELLLSREFLDVSLACLGPDEPDEPDQSIGSGGGGSSPERQANTTVVLSHQPSALQNSSPRQEMLPSQGSPHLGRATQVPSTHTAKPMH
jgi:hypothetical protein